MIRHVRNWWQGECGIREVLWFALPLVVSTVSWTVMIFIDRLFLTWYSAEAVASALPAGNLAFVVVCFPLGVATYVGTFVSQYYGANRRQRIGVAVWQGVALGIATVPIALAINPLASLIFSAVGHAPEIVALETAYFQALNYAAGAMVIGAALSAFFTGRGDARTVMIVDSLAALVNIVLDYCWIFGHFGFPEAGIAGAAWATVVALWFKTAVYMVLWLAPRFREEYHSLRGCRWDGRLFRRLLWFGAPNGLHYVLEMGAFTAFIMVLGRLELSDVAATTLAFNINSLAFMPVYGIGLATTSLVGRRLGEDRPRLAARAAWSGFALATGLMLLVGSLYVFGPDLLLLPHASQVPAEQFVKIAARTTVLLRFVAAYCLFDAMNIIFASAIKGAGDTRFVFWTTLILSPLMAGLAWMGGQWWDFALLDYWLLVTVWVCLLGVIYLLRFLYGPWREMRVIEPAVHVDEVPGEPGLAARETQAGDIPTEVELVRLP